MRLIYIKAVLVVWLLLCSIKMVGQEGAIDFVTDSNRYKVDFTYNIDSAKYERGKFVISKPISKIQIQFSSIKKNIPNDWDIEAKIDEKKLILSEGEFFIIDKPVKQNIVLEIGFVLSRDGKELNSNAPLKIEIFKKSDEKPVTTTTNTVNLSEDDKAWKEVNTKKSGRAYCDFVARYPNSPYVREARKQCAAFSPMTVKQDRVNDSVYSFVVGNLTTRAQIDTDSGFYVKEESYNSERFEFSFKAVIRNQEGLGIKICDGVNPSMKVAACITTTVGNILQADWSFNREGDSILFRISGGVFPYNISLKREGIVEYYGEGIPKRYAIAIAFLRDTLPIGGEYTIEIIDGTNFTYKELPKKISIDKPFFSVKAKRKFLYVLSIIVVLTLLWFIFKYRIKQRAKKYREIAHRNFQDDGNVNLLPSPGTTPGSPPSDLKPEIVRVNIKPKVGRGEEPWESFKGKRLQFPYLPISMGAIWSDSLVETIYISQEAVFSLHKFVEEENFDLIPTRGGNIPEIGGMLMGNYCDQLLDDERLSYQVSIEKFIPIEARKQNMYQLEFNIDILVNSVLEVQDKYPDLLVVGWFHTHPGHGVFLSDPDIRSQGQFKKPYQFAMVMDTCSENIDVGFFTWKSNMEINNKDDMKNGTEWFSWSEIEKLKRRKK